MTMTTSISLTEKPTNHTIDVFLIKNRDTRCSFQCTQNWTKYGTLPPIGHYCACSRVRSK